MRAPLLWGATTGALCMATAAAYAGEWRHMATFLCAAAVLVSLVYGMPE